jgi:hypothetical protein
MRTKRFFLVCIASLAFVSCSSDSPSDKQIEDIVENNLNENIQDSDVFDEACSNPIFADAPQCK